MILCRKFLDLILTQILFSILRFREFSRNFFSKISRISSFLKKPKFPKKKKTFLSKKDKFCCEKKKTPVYGIVKLGENIIIINMTQPN
jgi:hypothetical protein